MKKNVFVLTAAVAAMCLMFSCKTAQQPVSVAQHEGAVELSLPFSGKEFKSDSKMFREVGQGKSSDMPTAKKIAMTNALTVLAERVNNTTKAVTDQYTNQRNLTNAEEFEKKFEEMARIVVKQQLSNIDIVGEKVFKETDGRYTYYLVIEMSKDQILNALNNKISSDAQLKLDFDKFQYEKIFNEEMEKFENR